MAFRVGAVTVALGEQGPASTIEGLDGMVTAVNEQEQLPANVAPPPGRGAKVFQTCQLPRPKLDVGLMGVTNYSVSFWRSAKRRDESAGRER